MKWRRQFSGPVSVEDAQKRADKLLRGYGYRQVPQKTHWSYERGSNSGWAFALRPRGFLTTIHIFSEQMADHSTFVAELETNTLTGNLPTLGRKLIEGELDDLEQAIVGNKMPTNNRTTQNRVAGTTQGALILVLLLLSFAIGSALRTVNMAVAVVGFVVGFVVLFNLFNYLKLPGLPFPDFPIHNPPGALLVPEDNATVAPTAPRRR